MAGSEKRRKRPGIDLGDANHVSELNSNGVQSGAQSKDKIEKKRRRDSIQDDGEGFATGSEHSIKKKKKKEKEKGGGQISGVSLLDHVSFQDEGEGFEPSIKKKKKEKRVEQLTSVSLLDHGSVQNEGEGFGPGFEQKKKKKGIKGGDLDHDSMQDEGEGLELSLKMNRKKEKAVAQSKEKAVEHNKKEKHEQQVTRIYDSTQDDGEHHETSDKKKQKMKSKKEKDAKIVDFPPLHHNNIMQDEGENHGGGQKRKSKEKKKRDQEEHEAPLLDHGKVSMHDSEEDDMLFNFSVQPKVVVDNLASHGSKKEQVSHHLNGSSLQDDKTHYEGQKQSKKNNKNNKIPVEEKAKEVVKDSSNRTESSKYISRPTVSIAVAGSIIDNAQSLELATMLAGQIARAAAIFRIDEIVVFDDYDGASTPSNQAKMQDDNGQETGGIFLVRILEYLEVPQYLRRVLIPMHGSLSSVGKLPPLDAPHHLRRYEWQPFREGVVLDKRPSSGSGSYVDVGLDKEVLINQLLKPGTRVTVAMGQTKTDGDMLQVVDHEAAREAGIYWGYRVRYASCLSAVFEECPFEGKYDYCIGTSEHGKKVRPMELLIPKCRHLLIAFGGLSGLEESLELDKRLKVHNITSLFDQYLNTCPNQGSRTIRTEEAILISLQFLQEAVQQAICPT